MIASSMVGVSEALLYAGKSGVKIPDMIELLSGGAASSFTLMNLAPKMFNRDFAPGFYVEHFHKDLSIALEESKKMGLKFEGTDLALKYYTQHMEEGGAREGTTGILKTFEKNNETEIPKPE